MFIEAIYRSFFPYVLGSQIDTKFIKNIDTQSITSNYSLTDEDLVNWYNACVEYAKEYIEAESKVVFPTIEEIRNQCIRINSIRKMEIQKVEELIQKVALNLFLNGTSDYELREIRRYYQTLKGRFFDPDKYPQSIQNTNYGRNFVKETNGDLKPDWYYTHLIESLEKYQ